MIADFLGAHEDARAEAIPSRGKGRISALVLRVSEQVLANVTRSWRSRSATESCKTSVYISNGGISRMPPERSQHGVGDVADAGLNGQERLGNSPGLDSPGRNSATCCADRIGFRRGSVEPADFILHIGFHDARDARGIDA